MFKQQEKTSQHRKRNDWFIQYQKEAYKKMTFAFNKETDKDILDYLDQVESKLGTIKQALREYMQNHK